MTKIFFVCMAASFFISVPLIQGAARHEPTLQIRLSGSARTVRTGDDDGWMLRRREAQHPVPVVQRIQDLALELIKALEVEDQHCIAWLQHELEKLKSMERRRLKQILPEGVKGESLEQQISGMEKELASLEERVGQNKVKMNDLEEQKKEIGDQPGGKKQKAALSSEIMYLRLDLKADERKKGEISRSLRLKAGVLKMAREAEKNIEEIEKLQRTLAL